jgi:hypothetical protein
MSSVRSRSRAAIARRYSARWAWLIRGQGPSSKASRAAVTARVMSACSASATLKNSSSVAESITSILAADEGLTHSPPMKKRSALRRGRPDVVCQAHLAASGHARRGTQGLMAGSGSRER